MIRQIFLSTTFHGNNLTDIYDVLSLVDGLDIDGIELGSTHRGRVDLLDVIREKWRKDTVTHNFFPPSNDTNFVINIASVDSDVRSKSISHAKYCIEFASNIGASIYTVHPGFIATPSVNRKGNQNYDFDFTEQRECRKTAFSNMVESLSQLIAVAKKNKIKLAIETEGSLAKPGVLLMERIDEYDSLFAKFPEDLYLNPNLAHTRLASIEYKYKMNDFIMRYYNKVALVEVSHNNGKIDQHLPLVEDSYVFNYLSLLPNVPYVLEFRNATIEQIKHSVNLMRRFFQKEYK